MADHQEPITDGKVVLFHYTLTSSDGEVLDKSEGEAAPYLHGGGDLVPGLERELEGKVAGSRFRAVVKPADGYGERDPDGELEVPRGAFPDDSELEPGQQFAVEQPDGNLVPLWITAVNESSVTVDRNHPLAGETLIFDIEVVAVRDATEEEKTHGHVHGSGSCAHH